MKRKIALLLSVAILFGFRPPKKNENNNQTLELDKALNTNNSLLWQISGNGLTQPSYLFGTIHIISTQDYFLGKNVQKKLENSHELIMEMDLENMDIAALSAISILDSGKTIKNYLSDSDYQIIQTFMEDSIGVKKFTFEQFYARLKPFYLEQLIYIKYL
nr:TraB/GumN family protein [Chitinophagales bacterium]